MTEDASAARPAPELGDSATERTVTRLLLKWARGDIRALDEMVPEVVNELRRTARWLMDREAADHTLQPTALVHELYLRLRRSRTVSWENRRHFFSFAGEAMRRILVDHARTRDRSKRGGGWSRVELDDELALGQLVEMPDEELLALDEALDRLAQLDERQCRVVELRFFLGLTAKQAARALGSSLATVHRDWALARAWLLRELNRGGRTPV